MTVTFSQLMLYALGMAGLWAVPGPVWVALTARALSGGMAAAWPLAVGVALGDLIWPLCAILGLAWVLSLYGDALEVLRWVAAAVFVVMGVLLIRKPAAAPGTNSRMTRPGVWAGFSVGVAAVIGNPKAILFYMGFLPGFFDLSRVTLWDILAILAISAVVPMLGNLGLALFLDRARRLLSSPEAVRRLNVGSGVLLIFVGLVIPFT
ncbi:Threonine/homoserine/homoserine lactone efflux protein [Gemmobacter megaterium]|uniref:Threonine/homoserine/homoserine lactone efflux protein n=1 Tax=Gemmobacter megaterium TaxID=1086013 RepID=A0A1N7MMU6_9RHOB|nr:LysE family translocator [Gemmobacter megaterium]GGE05985.1 lysine transporter LysE [Gemmobacter megaterium]SIS87219.1 Threonine/homoserine/homoserine lactone efflux protein [Gemmobacter megaterium]